MRAKLDLFLASILTLFAALLLLVAVNDCSAQGLFTLYTDGPSTAAVGDTVRVQVGAVADPIDEIRVVRWAIVWDSNLTFVQGRTAVQVPIPGSAITFTDYRPWASPPTIVGQWIPHPALPLVIDGARNLVELTFVASAPGPACVIFRADNAEAQTLVSDLEGGIWVLGTDPEISASEDCTDLAGSPTNVFEFEPTWSAMKGLWR